MANHTIFWPWPVAFLVPRRVLIYILIKLVWLLYLYKVFFFQINHLQLFSPFSLLKKTNRNIIHRIPNEKYLIIYKMLIYAYIHIHKCIQLKILRFPILDSCRGCVCVCRWFMYAHNRSLTKRMTYIYIWIWFHMISHLH